MDVDAVGIECARAVVDNIRATCPPDVRRAFLKAMSAHRAMETTPDATTAAMAAIFRGYPDILEQVNTLVLTGADALRVALALVELYGPGATLREMAGVVEEIKRKRSCIGRDFFEAVDAFLDGGADAERTRANVAAALGRKFPAVLQQLGAVQDVPDREALLCAAKTLADMQQAP